MATGPKTRISVVPQLLSDEAEWRRWIAAWALEVNQGRLNNVGTITLAINAATTVVTDQRTGANSFIGFMPTTANAATELGNGTLYISSQGKQTFTITHANNAQADRTFTYCTLG